MTKITFGPGVCYDCPQQKMAQQFAFFKDGLSDECFASYMELVQAAARALALNLTPNFTSLNLT